MDGRAVRTLKDLLEPHGELLPLKSEIGEYYAYNVTTVLDTLDRANCIMKWDHQNMFALEQHRFAFHAERITAPIFKIPESPVTPYVTNEFVERCRAAKLQGFKFEQLWPVDERTPVGGEDWKPSPFAAEAVMLQLQLAGNRPTAEEKMLADALLDDLDALLYSPDATEDPVGTLEGHEFTDGECRIFLSCPDAEALAKVLSKWAKGRKLWPKAYRGVKRAGHYRDGEAPERAFKLGV